MSATAIAAKIAAAVLTDENARKKLGWVLAAILSPILVIVALICMYSAASQQNLSTVELCFHGGMIPDSASPEYRQAVDETRASFDVLDSFADEINEQMKEEDGLDRNRIKAVFFSLYFGGQQPDEAGLQSFVDCLVTWTEETRTVTTVDEEGNEVETSETVRVPHPIEDMEEVYRRIAAALGVEITEEHRANANSVYNLVVYGSAAGASGGWFPGANVPFIGADGFCSPIGAGWESVVTSEFGNRIDPFTGKRKGHTGMDLAVPTGTPIRAALPGTVTVSAYDQGGYGCYIMIDHGNGLSTLYGHNSQLLAQVGQTVEAGDIISLSGSTGRSTGPHLHFEVRVNGQRTDPRAYLPPSGG